MFWTNLDGTECIHHVIWWLHIRDKIFVSRRKSSRVRHEMDELGSVGDIPTRVYSPTLDGLLDFGSIKFHQNCYQQRGLA